MHVTRLLATGETIEYDAILRIEAEGRALLERIKFLHACARIGAYELFKAAVDLPVAGFPDWWLISGHYQIHNRHTVRMGTNTRKVMDSIYV